MNDKKSIEIIDEKPISEIWDLKDRIREIRKKENVREIWYRGESLSEEAQKKDKEEEECKKHRLRPSIGRCHDFNRKRLDFDLRDEMYLFHRFKRLSYSIVGHVMGDWEALFLAQHHKLPTRILDWTKNPLAGLYFACENDNTKPGVLWGMVRREGIDDNLIDVLEEDKKGSSPFYKYIKDKYKDKKGKPKLKIDENEHVKPAVKALYPLYNSSRMIVQESRFTFHSQPHKSLQSYASEKTEFDDVDLDINLLIRWKIEGVNKLGIIEELEQLAINERTLFPDLDDLSKGLLRTEIITNKNRRSI